MTRIRNVGAVVLAGFALLVAARSVESAEVQDAGLRILVLEGEDSVNIIEGGPTVPTLVELRDREDLPVAGASVQFAFEEDGLATLNGGLQQVAVVTDALGRAAVTVNPIASGAVQLSITATYQGQTARAVIIHTSFATVAEAEGLSRSLLNFASGRLPVSSVNVTPLQQLRRRAGPARPGR